MEDPFTRMAKTLFADGSIDRQDLLAVLGTRANHLPADQLGMIARMILKRRPPFFGESHEARARGLRLYFEWIEQEGGWQAHLDQPVVDDLIASSSNGGEPSLAARVAFGLLSTAHIEMMREAILSKRVSRRQLVDAAYDQAAIEQLLESSPRPVMKLRFPIADLNGQNMTSDNPTLGLSEIVRPDIPGLDMRLLVSNEAELQQVTRIETSTVAWLRGTVDSRSVVIDVGANIGLYSIVASKCGAKAVICCEPVPDNYARLIHNLDLNGLPATHAFAIAASDTTGPTVFGISNMGAGSWSHAGVGAAGTHTIGCMSYRLDDLMGQLEGLPATHLKVDVDGSEVSVIRGAACLLSTDSLTHVLVETNRETLPLLREILEPRGFDLHEPTIGVFGNCFFRKGKT